ncbi:MAG: hypothetical protein OXF43_08255, partial [Gammaproteobacteria bacterium]|nr:hypothetical protein [Gammaproteobacteria bacterium]
SILFLILVLFFLVFFFVFFFFFFLNPPPPPPPHFRMNPWDGWPIFAFLRAGVILAGAGWQPWGAREKLYVQLDGF